MQLVLAQPLLAQLEQPQRELVVLAQRELVVQPQPVLALMQLVSLQPVPT
jgi:hypothetical protein